MAYYPDWTSAAFPPEKVDFGRYDWVDFAFAVPLSDFSLGWDGSDDDPDVLRRLVAAAHQAGKKVKVSVGGWTGSKYFSAAVATAQSRETFAGSILGMYNQYGVDGIDIDWEFPGQSGNDGNGESPGDAANFLSFLQLLRTTLPPQAKITAATMTVPWADAQGNPLKDVSAFAQVLDWILIMNYDTWGSSSPPGPNAPLSNACHNSTQSSASAVAGVATWTAAGFPASQIVLGVPSYGYIARSASDALTTRALVSRRPRHVPMHLDGPAGDALGTDALDDPLLHAAGAPGAAPAVTNEDGGADAGQVQFRDLVGQGVLQYVPAWSTSAAARVASGDPGDAPSDAVDASDDAGAAAAGGPGDPDAALSTLSFAGHTIANVFTAADGFERRWDACSSTPYLRSAAARQVVAYDDPQSLEMKATFARYAGLRGVNLFDIHGDTDNADLADALRRGLGL
ncbi:glycoside hydrolase family 18 protein [Phlebiopsis gigantea 11061_1 CR5-6]|uniref:Glycoside hydrolase family 18 protein n=1 Tax=Phlebiopsis gigantea (strain 11061_1 CR5-6) TaxID=745531 RepID=A0A0C3NC82_PHLG1|nr:glycoside hydrolase family 18 protein [Phlebiopsis gigantea 11061_1 CR5-6]